MSTGEMSRPHADTREREPALPGGRLRGERGVVVRGAGPSGLFELIERTVAHAQDLPAATSRPPAAH